MMVGTLKLQLVDVPVGSALHFKMNAEVHGNKVAGRQAYFLVEHPCGQILLSLLFVRVGVELVVQRRSRQALTLQLADGLPVLSVSRCLAVQAVALCGRLVIVGHHAVHHDDSW